MIFGASQDSSDTGYALTLSQVVAGVGSLGELTQAVDTQECVAG